MPAGPPWFTETTALSILFSGTRTLAKITRSRGAKRGATAGSFQTTSGHCQPPSTQLSPTSGDVKVPPGTHWRCLLSSGSQVRILPGALIKSPAQPVYAPTGDWPSCFVPPWACQFRARCLLGSIGFAECRTGSLADRIGKHRLSLVRRVQVDQRSSCTAMPHAVHQLTQVRARTGGQGVSGMPQVVKVDTRTADLSDGGQPDTAVEPWCCDN